jgi:hypothetical protein
MESISSKVGRFRPHHKNQFITPRIPIDQNVIKRLQTAKRHPASVTSVTHAGFAKHISNKSLYFATLLEQYRTLQQFTNHHSPEIISCPHFHSTLLNMPNNHQRNRQLVPLTNIATTKTPVEYYLPVSNASDGAKVIDFPASQRATYLKKAINIHLQKMHHELTDLCQTGSSDSYYTFANLQQSGTKLKKPSPEAVAILLKMPIFTNELLISSLNSHQKHSPSRSIASVSPIKYRPVFQEVSKRLQINWFETYIRYAKK